MTATPDAFDDTPESPNRLIMVGGRYFPADPGRPTPLKRIGDMEIWSEPEAGVLRRFDREPGRVQRRTHSNVLGYDWIEVAHGTMDPRPDQ